MTSSLSGLQVLDLVLCGVGLCSRRVLFREHDGELGVGVGTLQDEIGAFVVAVSHQLLRLLDLFGSELEVKLRLRLPFGAKLACASRSGLGAGQTVGRGWHAAAACNKKNAKDGRSGGAHVARRSHRYPHEEGSIPNCEPTAKVPLGG